MKNPGGLLPDFEVKTGRSPLSPLRLLLILVTGIFFAEALAMIVIYFIHTTHYWIEILLDATLMVILIIPVLYFFHFRPLFHEIADRNRSEGLLRNVLESLPVGVWIIDQNGAILHGNPASRKIWAGARYVGIDQYGEYKAWRLDSGKPVEPGGWGAARAVKHGETILDEELEIECFNGSRKIILHSAIPIYDHGAIQGAIVVNQDITERKRAEQALIHSNQLLQGAFNSIDVLIAYMDRDFNFIQVNEAYARVAGYPMDYFPGKNHFELYPHSENQAIFERVVETCEPISVLEKPFEFPEYPERGVTYWNWRVQPVLGADGVVQGIVLSLVDVTERKRGEILLERQNQDLHNLSIAESKQHQLAESLMQSMLTLNASLEPEEVLSSTLEQIRLFIPYERANIVLIERDGLRIVRQLDLTGDHEIPVAGERLYEPADFPVIEKVCSTHKPVLMIEDPGSTPFLQVVPGLACLGACIIFPLIVGERVIGVISLCASQPDVFTEETIRRLQAFAVPAALAIANAHLYAAELKARQVAETLNAVSLALTQTLSFEKVMNTLLEYVYRLVPSDHSYIVIVEDESNLALQVICQYDNGCNQVQTARSPYENPEKSYLLEIIATQKSLLIPDFQLEHSQRIRIAGTDIRSWLGIPIVVGNKTIGVLALAKSCPEFFTGEHRRLAEVIVSQASVAIQNAWLFEQVRAGHERFQSLSRRLIEIQESERRYVARELHDVASQTLTALMFGLRQLEQEAQHSEYFLLRLREMNQLASQVLEELHHLAMGLRPASLDYLGLVDSLGQLAKDFGKRFDLNVCFKATSQAKDLRLPDIFETNVYRIVQEALTNAVRHANAKNIDVILEYRAGKAIILIEDDGISFDTAHVPKSGHLGLLGMQERAEIISGTLQIESVKGHGTTILLEVPYADSNPDCR